MLNITRAAINVSKNIIRSRLRPYEKIHGVRVANNVILAVCYSNNYRQREKTKIEQIRLDAAKKIVQRSPKLSALPAVTNKAAPVLDDVANKIAAATLSATVAAEQTRTKREKETTEEEQEEKDEVEVKDQREASLATSGVSPIMSSVPQAESTRKSVNDEHDQVQEESWPTMKVAFSIFGVTFTLIVLFIVLKLDDLKTDEDSAAVVDEYSSMPVLYQYFHRLVRQLNYYKKMINEPSREKLLPDVLEYPYHQPPYTVVLELKDVLVHPDWTYATGWRFKKRPGIDHFLQALNGIYEIVIYTAELGITVFPILEALDPNNLITYKLVRDATNFVSGRHVKELDKLNRDLNKVVMVDWDGDSFRSNRDNVLKIPRWDGNDDDTVLLHLASLLQVIAMSDVRDVREVLRYYGEFPDPIATFKDKQRELEVMYAKQAK